MDSKMLGVNFTCISATPYEQINHRGMESISHYIDPGYHGPSRYVIDDDTEIVFEESPGVPAKTTHPGIHSYESFFGVQDLNVPSYEDAEKYLVKQEGFQVRAAKNKLADPQTARGCKRRWQQYRVRFERDLAGIIDSLLLKREVLGVPYDKSDGEEPIGMLLRYPKSNAKTRLMMEQANCFLGEKSDEVLFLVYFERPRASGRNRTMDTLKNFIAENNPDGKPYVVWVTNAARMGVAFPVDTHYFLDLTASATTATAALQGSAGRATGFGKNSGIFLSREFARDMQNFYATGRWTGKYHMRTAFEIVAGRPCKNGTIVTTLYDEPEIVELIEIIRVHLQGQFKRYWNKYQKSKGLWVNKAGILLDKDSHDPPLSKDDRVRGMIQGGKGDAVNLWPTINLLMDELEKYPERVMHGVKEGAFDQVPFVRFEPDEIKRNRKLHGSGHSVFVAEYDERHVVSHMVSRRLSQQEGLDSMSSTVREHNEPEDPTQYGLKDNVVHASIFYSLFPTPRRSSARPACPRLEVKKFQLPFRFASQKTERNLIAQRVSMYWKRTVKAS